MNIMVLFFAHSAMCLLTFNFRYCGMEIWLRCSVVLCRRVSPDSPMYFSPQPLHVITQIKFLTPQSISFLMLNSVLFGLFITTWLQTTICLHVSQRLSSHFVTLGVLSIRFSGVNFARVSIRLRFCGWRLLGIIFVFSTLFFNFGLAFNIEIDSLIIGKTLNIGKIYWNFIGKILVFLGYLWIRM